MVESCRLDSMSIFFSARSAPFNDVVYLFHHGVSPEAQHAYKQGGVFAQDPFTHAIDPRDRNGHMIRWGEHRLARFARTASDYREFISCFSVDVVGAWVQQLLPDFFLVIGAHCRTGGRSRNDVRMELLAHEAPAIGQVVVSALLEEMAAGAGAIRSLASVLQSPAGGPERQDPARILTERELEIARLVAAGHQNKQVAYLAAISEFTVENHLRSIYSKLKVHNRTGMILRLFGQTCQ
jgi:DNA-binding CsgD family transcriptional regulator